ncbi:MAG: diaminopimelate decarboxylase [Clostridiales bacterium]|nr:diaminopimelate decarboxylase [Clostridiales bacterium]
MLVSDCLDVNTRGHLTIGGCDTVDLAQKYGTPLYVLDENQIRQNCRDYKQSIEENYEGKGLPLYASKALCCKALCRIARDEGMGLDVVSGGELYTALQAGFPMERVYFHGNNKTYDELLMAVENGGGRIVVDNLTELQTLDALCREKGVRAKISFRIKPGIDAHTHSFIRTGQIDSKFGLALETGEAMEAVKQAIACAGVELVGLHCHIGSQIFDINPFILAAQVMVGFMADIRAETGKVIGELNLGGGFGIKYTRDDQPVPYGDYMKQVSAALKEACAEKDIPLPFVLIEPGRSVTGAAGLTLYTVGGVKEIPDVRTYVSVDGGMGDNPRYILYQSEYEVLVANKANQPAQTAVTVAGKCCESGDLIQEHVKLADPEVGDTLAVLSTGAYNYSMASNYNRIPKPAIVAVKDGESRLIVSRETYEDLASNDV